MATKNNSKKAMKRTGKHGKTGKQSRLDKTKSFHKKKK